MKSKHVIAIAVACAIAVVGTSPIMAISARAEEVRQNKSLDSSTESETTPEATDEDTDRKEAAKIAREKVAAQKTEKLAGKKLEQCEKKQQGIVVKLEKMATQGHKQAEVFKKILDRVEQFRIDKNYPEQTDLYDKADAAYKDAMKLGSTAAEIPALADCSEGNIKAVVESFREEQKSQIGALKNFRSAVNDYIVAVKSSAKNQTETEDN